MKKKELPKFYAKEFDTNTDTLIDIDVLSVFDAKELETKRKKEFEARQDVKDYIEQELKYYYWSRTEHEMFVKEAFTDKEVKIDVFDQVEKNLDVITDLVINVMEWKF